MFVKKPILEGVRASMKPAPSRLWIGILSLAAVVTVLGVMTAPALMAQEEGAAEPAVAAEEAAPAAEAPMEPAEATAEQTPPTPPGTPPAGEGAEGAPPTPETIEVVTETVDRGRGEDEQRREFREDMARRTSPLDKQEMYDNEHDWYRIVKQYDYNAIPHHKEIGVSNGSDWWSEYCGN